jgi:general secretion pathway protein G
LDSGKDKVTGLNRPVKKELVWKRAAFTLVELLFVVAIIATLSAIAIPAYTSYVEKARVVHSVAEIKVIAQHLDAYDPANALFPPGLADIDRDGDRDPWGNPYVYTNLDGLPPGAARKDKFLVPLNSDYDLYSKGKDGDSNLPLTAPVSKDDVIRANDGAFIGLAIRY